MSTTGSSDPRGTQATPPPGGAIGATTTGKQRAARIPLDYYKKPDHVARMKWLLTVAATVAAGVWIVTLFAAPKSSGLGLERVSHGPVCAQHAAFGHACSECHVDFALFSGKDPDGIGRSTFVGDQKCLQCHLGEHKNNKWEGTLAVHSPFQKSDMTPTCGTCHTDHKGVDFNLKVVADGSCTVCHKNLKNSMTGKGSNYHNDVSAFPKDHPDFRSVKQDPGKIKFNHKYHMTEGIVLTVGGKPFTVGQMKEGSLKERHPLAARHERRRRRAPRLRRLPQARGERPVGAHRIRPRPARQPHG
jgi:hypothetical protein